MWDDESIPELLERQQGLVLRSQALAGGLSSGAISWRLGRGWWQRVVPGLYATFTGALSDQHRLVAAALYGGPGAQITGAAALRWHGLRYAPADPRVHVLVLTPHPSRGFIRTLRTTRPDPHSRLRPAMEICSVARAGADAARSGYGLREVRAFLAEIVQRRLASLDMLDDEARHGPNARSSLLRQVLKELRSGVRSAPEAELRTVVESSSILPPVRWNPHLVAADGTPLPTPDGWIQEVGLALEQNSREFHSTPDGWQLTLDRQNQLATYGVLTVHVTPHAVRRQPSRVLATIERAYRERPTGFDRVRAVE